MSITQAIQEMLKPSLFEPKTKIFNEWTAHLSEPKQLNCKVKITGLTKDCLIIRSDACCPPSHMFQSKKGECRRADFLFISETLKKIVVVEFKCGSDGKKSSVIQHLKGSLCLSHLFGQVSFWFWNEPNFANTFEFQFVWLIKGVRKRGTNVQRKIRKSLLANNNPNNPLKIYCGKSVTFKELIS